MLFSRQIIVILLLCSFSRSALQAQPLPREDVVDAPSVGAGLSLHNLFQTNMVLQRDKPVRIWGWAEPGELVTVALAGQERSATTGEDRSWQVVFPAMSANSVPQDLVVAGREKSLRRENLLVGDVWVLGGQSNMEFPLERIENGNLEIVSANYSNIRILTIPAQNGPDAKTGFPRLHEWSDWSKRHFRKGDWDVCSPAIARELSAIGYVFARRIHMASQVPIGVIDVSRGGTTVETWTPDATLRTIDSPWVDSLLAQWDERIAQYDPQHDLAARVEAYRKRVEGLRNEGKEIPVGLIEPSDLRPGPAADQNRPGNCYASMIAPLAGFSIKGVIFHQGYNNCFQGSDGAEMYAAIFPQMIAAWRAAFGDPELPFGIVSLCTEGERQTRTKYTELMLNAGPHIREAQYKTFLGLYQAGDRNIGFASTYDLRRRWYHPQLKIPAGERIARWALATQYGFNKEIRWKPPLVQGVNREEGRIVLQFDEPVSPVDDGGPIEGFAIAGDDQKFHPADATFLINGNDARGRPQKDSRALVLTSPLVPVPVHYRYAWARSPLGNLQANGNSDIPVATQRSDDWSWDDNYQALVGKPRESDTTLARGERNELIRVLRAEDIRRRQAEADVLSAEQADK